MKLQTIVSQYLQWQEYKVIEHAKVGFDAAGKSSFQLDIVAYQPVKNHVYQVEIIEATQDWLTTKADLVERFEWGRVSVFTEVLPQLGWRTNFKQFALVNDPEETLVSNAQVQAIHDYLKNVRRYVRERAQRSLEPIPAKYDQLQKLLSEEYF